MCAFGEKIDEYEILEHLGKGGFAHVYRAKCLRSGSFVAIKMIDKALMASAGMVGRVRQEVTIHSRLKHPAVLELFTFFEDVHYVYLVLELAHNGELAKHFRLGTRGLSERAAADIFRQVVAGVTYLHSHNILHRDLSLNNLLLTKDMRVKIADFGLATQLNAPDEKHVTMCGTPNYISPEVASRECHGLPADVWGLGCMLYTLLVGSPPFHTQHVKSTLNKVINADYKIPSELSLQAQDLLQRLLCRDPSKRISLRGILEHPFLNMSFEFPANSARQDLSRDSGFQTTLHSTQHTKPRSEDRSAASANADFLKLHRQNSLEKYVPKSENRPSSFNVLTGIRDGSNVVSCNSSGVSFSQPQSSSTHCTNEKNNYVTQNISTSANSYACKPDTLENIKMYELNTLKLHHLQVRNPKEDGNPKLENKENFPTSSNVHSTSIGVPPLCADRLPPITHRTRNAILKIETDAVVVEFIKKKGKDREEVVTEVCKISRDGMKIVVYPIDVGKGKLLLSQKEVINHQPSPDEVFTYHNLPQKHWKKYLYAARFVDLVKAKTPKITLYSSKAKCQLMENGTDFELFFYEGEKVTFNASDGLKIIDKTSKIHSNPVITEELQYISDHFKECLARCRRVEMSLSSIPDECFPLIIGKRPTQFIGKNVSHQQATPVTSCTTPLLNIGSFYHGTMGGSTKADSECNNPYPYGSCTSNQQNIINELGQLPIRRPLQPKYDNYH